MTNDNSTLFHYTNIKGAHSILRSLTLWASDARYLNDRQELTSSIEMLTAKLSDVKNLKLALSINNYFRNFCIFSLSASPQVLSQWRSYGDDGTGMCIGFDTEKLRTKNQDLYPHMELVECVYDNHDFFIYDLLEKEKDSLDELSDICRKFDPGNELYNALRENPKSLDKLFTQLLRMKNPAFSEEKEWRLVFCVDSKDIKTRTSGRIMIPYIEHRYHDDDCRTQLWDVAKQIWLGPKSDERNRTALKSFDQAGWEFGHHLEGSDVGIYRFECGYR